jgi:putative spermidine/putrescine transport system permease protein
VVKRRATLLALSLPPYLWLGLFLIIPILLILALSFQADIHGGAFGFWPSTLNQYREIFEIDPYGETLGFSIAVAFIVSVLAVVLAYPVAYFLVFRAGRAAALCLLLLLIPFLTSFLLRVMAWMILLEASPLLYTRGALVLTLTYVWIPFAALPIAAALQRIDPELVEASLDLGASPWRCFRTITFPLSLPGVLAAYFMVFIPTVGEYVMPELLGGPYSWMYGNLIVEWSRGEYLPLGAALSMVMLVVTLSLVAFAARLINLKAVPLTQTRPAVSGRFTLLTAYFVGVIALLYLPLAILFLRSLEANTGLDLTLRAYGQVFENTQALQAVGNSLFVAVISSCVATVLGTALALLHMRFSFRGDKLLFALTMLPLVVPAIILAVALKLLFLRAGIDRSLATIAIAHTVVALPYVVLIVSVRLSGFDPNLEEVAMDLGAPYGRVILNIVLPLIAPSILAAWLVAFTVSFDEVAIAYILKGSENTFPIYLFKELRLIHIDRLPMNIALVVMVMVVTLLLALTAEWIRRSGQPSTVR